MHSSVSYLSLETPLSFSYGDFTLTSALPSPLAHFSRQVESATVRDASSTIAWEALPTVPKICYHAQSRYYRAVPVWELQAPDNWFSLATLLKVIDLEVDSECVLTARKIHKLGLNSATILREHFSRFGEVDRVMLLPSRPKSHSGAAAGLLKVRPASMAFVVMRSRQPSIIARLNEVHYIEGHPVQVQKFRKEQEEPELELPLLFDDYSWLESSSTDCTPPTAPLRKNSYAAQFIN
jgi:hypothetical protein